MISLQKGLYQGDPLSVVIFNTVMNSLVDTITTRIDLGYQFSNSSRKVNNMRMTPAGISYQLDGATGGLSSYILLKAMGWSG